MWTSCEDLFCVWFVWCHTSDNTVLDCLDLCAWRMVCWCFSVLFADRSNKPINRTSASSCSLTGTPTFTPCRSNRSTLGDPLSPVYGPSSQIRVTTKVWILQMFRPSLHNHVLCRESDARQLTWTTMWLQISLQRDKPKPHSELLLPSSSSRSRATRSSQRSSNSRFTRSSCSSMSRFPFNFLSELENAQLEERVRNGACGVTAAHSRRTNWLWVWTTPNSGERSPTTARVGP